MPTKDRGPLASARSRARRTTARDRNGPVRIILFDGNDVDHLDELPERPDKLRGSKLLWVDVDRAAGAATEIGRAFDLDDATCDRLASSADDPVFNDFDRYIHVTTYSPSEEVEGELTPLECVVGKNWVITAHDEPVPVLEEFAERVSGSGNTGDLDGPAFLATLLEWVLGAYSESFEELEERLEDFDVEAMRGADSSSAEQDIEKLVGMRREVGVLRRALAAHRSALTALTHPELEALGNDASGERFQSLLNRFEATVQEARDAREAIVGSFDVLIARTGHRTNGIMKILTLTSVILLPGALIAGVMGMNFRAAIFDATWLFYVVLGLIVAIAAVTLGVAKARSWI